MRAFPPSAEVLGALRPPGRSLFDQPSAEKNGQFGDGLKKSCFADISGIWIYWDIWCVIYIYMYIYIYAYMDIWIYVYMHICIYVYMYICTYTYARVYARVYDPHGIYRLYLLQKWQWLRSSENRSATDPIGPSRHKDIMVHTSPTSIATGS